MCLDALGQLPGGAGLVGHDGGHLDLAPRCTPGRARRQVLRLGFFMSSSLTGQAGVVRLMRHLDRCRPWTSALLDETEADDVLVEIWVLDLTQGVEDLTFRDLAAHGAD